jgi:exodeoxyribonuclease VII large subunit
MRQRLIQETTQRMQSASQYCQLLKQKLVTLDPEAVLRRGYAVVRQANGVVARSTAELEVGQELNVQLAQGQMTVQITHLHPSIRQNLDIGHDETPGE